MPCACLLIRRRFQPLPWTSSWEGLQGVVCALFELWYNTSAALKKQTVINNAEKSFPLWKSFGSCSVCFCFSHLHKFVLQTCRSALQILHKACEVARRYNYFPGGMALVWATYYESCISSDQSCINEWNAMQDLESTRPDSPALFVDKSVLNFIRKSWFGSQEKSPPLPFLPPVVHFLPLHKCLKMFFFG